jgi:SAM-dependent methyltransferase
MGKPHVAGAPSVRAPRWRIAGTAAASRYIRVDDPTIMRYEWTGGHQTLRWDLSELGWWSRVYEYRWLQDVVIAAFGPGASSRTVLDVGCGVGYPGCFMFCDLGVGLVVAQDVKERNPQVERSGLPNLRYHRADMSEHVEGTADLVCCVSVLEHLRPDRQRAALKNMCEAVAPGGALMLTFDMPGFEWDTDLVMYESVLDEQGFELDRAETPVGVRLTNLNGPVRNAGWDYANRWHLSCYRLLAWRTPT